MCIKNIKNLTLTHLHYLIFTCYVFIYMMNNYLAFLIFVVIYSVLEIIYFFFSFKTLMKNIQNVQGGKKPNFRFFPTGLLTYLILFGIVWKFCIYKQHDKSILMQHIDASLISFAIYLLYDMINLVTFEDYSLGVAMMDASWGFIVINLMTWIMRSIMT